MGNKEFGNYLRLLRVKNKMTMTQTAEQTGITQGYISQIENGI
jgi:transcriptional regulator with XRE-family HTH domain